MPFADASTWFGIFCAIAMCLIILFRQRSFFDLPDLGSILAVFLAATNALPALYITYFGATSRLNASLPTELKGYEKFLALAGLCSFFISSVTIWSFVKKAWTR